MNLLAHALIAYNSLPELSGQCVTGALMADFFKGQALDKYPYGIRLGILQHKAVDSFTDSHKEFVAVRRLIASSGAARLCSGILTDIFWDHILASAWDNYGKPYCELGLHDFCTSVYKKLVGTKEFHSPAFAHACNWITGYSWLEKYKTKEGIIDTLKGVQSRMSGQVDLVASVSLLTAIRAELEGGFRQFWPELIAFSKSWYSAFSE